MKARRKPLVIKEVKFASADNPASRKKIEEVYRLLLRHSSNCGEKENHKAKDAE